MQQDTRFSAEDLERLLAGQEFVRSERLAGFLRYLWQHSQTSGERLKETEIGTAVFGRQVGYDPKIDSIVRVEATRLRKKLAAHYAGEGAAEPVQVRLPQGRYELEFVAAHPSPLIAPEPEPATAVPSPDPASRHRRGWAYVAAGIAALAGLIGLMVWQRPPAQRLLPVMPLTSLKGSEQTPAVSPDGNLVAFAWDADDASRVERLYLTRPGSGHPTRLTSGNGPGESCPAWSRNGKELAYFRRVADGRLELRVRRMADGAEESFAELRSAATPCPGLSISPDGAWLATAEEGPDNLYHLVMIARASREKRFFRPVSGKPASRTTPVFSPDGRQVAFVEAPEASSADVYVADFPERGERRITFDHRPVRGLSWIPGQNALVVASYRERGSSSLWRVALDGSAPERLLEPGSGGWHPSVAANGSMAFTRYMHNTEIWRGTPGALWIASVGLNSSPRFSPDGRKLAFRSNRSGSSEIWVVDSPEAAPRRLTLINGPVTGSPRWSPDGQTIVFDSRMQGKADVFAVAVTGGAVRRITDAESNEVTPCYSRDGRFVYYASDREGPWAVWRKPVGGGAEELVRRKAFAPQISPDGRYLYYMRGPSEPGLYRAPLEPAGEEEAVLPKLNGALWGNWTVTSAGVFYIDPVEGRGGAELKRMGTDGKTAVVAAVGVAVLWDGGLDVTANGEQVAYAVVGRSDSDLYWTPVVR